MNLTQVIKKVKEIDEPTTTPPLLQQLAPDGQQLLLSPHGPYPALAQTCRPTKSRDILLYPKVSTANDELKGVLSSKSRGLDGIKRKPANVVGIVRHSRQRAFIIGSNMVDAQVGFSGLVPLYTVAGAYRHVLRCLDRARGPI
jgi:hypothetical protein